MLKFLPLKTERLFRRMMDPRFIVFFFAWILRLAYVRLIKRRPILLFSRDTGIGDIICTFPALEQLRQAHPRAAVIFIVREDFKPIARASLLGDFVGATNSALDFVARRIFRPALIFRPNLPDEKFPKETRLPIHLIEEMQRSLGLPPRLTQPKLYPSKAAQVSINAFFKTEGIEDQRIVLLHSGPTWPVKEWPLAQWNALALKLAESGNLLICHVGTGGTVFDGTETLQCAASIRDWRGLFSLDEMMALMSRSSLLIGVDSGLLHMAGAVGTSTLGLFGPTAPECFMPVEGVHGSITANIPCIGCHHHKEGPLHWTSGCPFDIACMHLLSTDDVCSIALRLIGA